MTEQELIGLTIKIGLAGFGAVGVMEWLKNFFKFKKTWVYALVMPVFAVGCCETRNLDRVKIAPQVDLAGVVQLALQRLPKSFDFPLEVLVVHLGKMTVTCGVIPDFVTFLCEFRKFLGVLLEKFATSAHKKRRLDAELVQEGLQAQNLAFHGVVKRKTQGSTKTVPVGETYWILRHKTSFEMNTNKKMKECDI